MSRPIKKLCGFERVFIKARQKQTVKISIPKHILQIYDTHTGKMLVEEGEYIFLAGASSADIRSTAKLHINGEKPGLRSGSFEAQSFDSAKNIDIRYSRKLGCHYISPKGWDTSAVYGGVDLSGKKAIRLSAAACMGSCEAELKIGDASFNLNFPCADGKDEFSEYTCPLPEGLPQTGDLTISMPDGLLLSEIELL